MTIFILSVILGIATTLVSGWLPSDRNLAAFNRGASPAKIRGVNLGGWLLSEPWMMDQEWREMGCYDGNTKMASEFDCVSFLTQNIADSAFNDHYARWITTDDIQQIFNAGLNTIRIPIGYWSFRDIVRDTEHFPEMNLTYLDKVVAKAASLGMFVIIDLHGAPGAQKLEDAFTGQYLTEAYLPGFFEQSQYDRATQWLSWMTQRIHNNDAYKACVGIIEVLNEPQSDHDTDPMTSAEKDTLTQDYYPQALKAVRDAEAGLSISESDRLHVQFMDSLWDSGNPKSGLPSEDSHVAFDDHNYVTWTMKPDATQQDYIYYSCNTDNRLSNDESPKIVQEFSLTIRSDTTKPEEFDPNNGSNDQFYKNWWVAQQRLYEQTEGWIFWTWKTELGDPRWDYSLLLEKGWVEDTADGLDTLSNTDICN